MRLRLGQWSGSGWELGFGLVRVRAVGRVSGEWEGWELGLARGGVVRVRHLPVDTHGLAAAALEHGLQQLDRLLRRAARAAGVERDAWSGEGRVVSAER